MILLDTHVLIWWLLDDRKLGRRAGSRIEDAWPENLAVSVLSWYELYQIQDRRRIRMKGSPTEIRCGVVRDGLSEINLDGEIALDAAGLGNISLDPMDRLIVATARVHGATLVTADESILDWGGELERLDARD